jgi:ArsR family transcriptional regulator, arsenate/arsenite/antimonite-responsive transcriptional repressor / arsenate reductase (thioredoxin)
MKIAVNTLQAPEFLKLIAHDIRWRLIKALVFSDFQVNELVELLGEKMNLVSYHLKKLRDEELVITRRSEADARDIYYSLNLEQLQARYFEAGSSLHPALGQQEKAKTANIPTLNILFVCSHNAARSQMAEGLLRYYASESIKVYSAGTRATSVHPDAIKTLAARGIDISRQQSKDLSQFSNKSFDYLITVCDNARETCPSFQAVGQELHWGFADPLQIANTAERVKAFEAIASQLDARIQHFLQSLNIAQ